MSKGVQSTKKLLDMLKPRLLAAEMLKRRVEEKSRDRNLILNNADLQILGNCTQATTPSLIVNSEGHTYLFNCGEGTQRLCYNNKIKLSNIEDVFITNVNWSSVAGVYGLALTLQDVGAPSICLHSLDGIEKIFDIADNNFITFNTGMKCITRNVRQGDCGDFGLHIEPIVINSDFKSNNSENIDEQDDESRFMKKFKLNPKLVAYFCSLPDLPGSLDPNKCRQLKVPVGPQLGILKSGKDVTLSDGRIIKSADVCGPKNTGLKFLVVDCPTEDQVDSLIENKVLRSYQTLNNDSKTPDMVIHLAPEFVVSSKKYNDWMRKFENNCKHLIISNKDSKRVNFVECYRMQYLMNKIDNEMFHPLYLSQNFQEIAEKEILESGDKLREDIIAAEDGDRNEVTVMKGNLDEIACDNIVRLDSMDKVVLRPQKSVETIDPSIALNVLYQEAQLDPHFEELLRDLKAKQSALPKSKEHEPEVLFLGTGSALPSKLRNTSCILVNFKHPEDISIILDCGEDSYGQLYRYYGPNQIENVLRRLKLIYISHHHADHHIGLIKILEQRRRVTSEPIPLLLPPNIDMLLKYHNENFLDISDSYEIFPTKLLSLETNNYDLRRASAEIIKRDLFQRLNNFLCDLRIVPVQHCVNSCAVVMRFNINHPDMDTFTLSYSGDARPSARFAELGKGSDLLIHEATFDHRLMDDARLKRHSTSREAIQVGRDMSAKFTILTHFSQRLPKIPYITDDFDEKVGFAFDNLSIRCPSHFARFPIMIPVLVNVFKKSLAEVDMKFYKAELKQRAISDMIAEKKSNAV